ncbi:MAG TPA: hypothetical protein DCY13_09435, partial [Verrucomicrobiales bacterium]|nr:hypothetical protein [Verrucomicrobiales bacterium]
ALLLPAGRIGAAGPVRTNLYFTGYDLPEGYQPAFVLADQNGWRDAAENMGTPVTGLISNGLDTNLFAGFGHQGWIGWEFATPPFSSVNLWRRALIDPVPAATPVVRFGVRMSIYDSTNSRYDFFRWSIYNSRTNRLFSIDFSNDDFSIAYILENNQTVVLTNRFTPFVADELEVSMHFADNKWNAWFAGKHIVTNAPITTGSLRRSLGEIHAIWLPQDRANPGDNRMVFDNFRLSAESLPTPAVPPALLTLGRTTNGFYALRLNGEDEARYVLDFSTNATTWTPLKTNVAVDGSFDYVDTNAPVLPERLFRARLLSE